MNQINAEVSIAVREAFTALGQSQKVAARVLAWLAAAGGEGLSAEEKAQRIGEIREEIEPKKAQ